MFGPKFSSSQTSMNVGNIEDGWTSWCVLCGDILIKLKDNGMYIYNGLFFTKCPAPCWVLGEISLWYVRWHHELKQRVLMGQHKSWHLSPRQESSSPWSGPLCLPEVIIFRYLFLSLNLTPGQQGAIFCLKTAENNPCQFNYLNWFYWRHLC